MLRLQTHYDKIKRKALLAPGLVGNENTGLMAGADGHPADRVGLNEQQNKHRSGMAFGATVDMGAVVGDMEANGVRSSFPLGMDT